MESSLAREGCLQHGQIGRKGSWSVSVPVDVAQV